MNGNTPTLAATTATGQENDMLCTTHYIRKSVLKELVLADLQRVTSYVKEHEQEFIETANECSAKAVQKTLTQQRKELDKAQNRINELNILFRKSTRTTL